jgi:hypothetical protein
MGGPVLAAAGDLVGNWSWTVWLLIPIVVVAALVTALVLGPLGEPGPEVDSERGVSRFLAQRTGTGSGSGSDKEAS